MSFQQAVQAGINNFANFNGRAMRSEFWYWVLFGIGVSILANILDNIVGTGGMVGSNGAISTLASLALLVPNLSAGVRRLHDIDKSGWWILVGVIPILGWIYLIYLYAQPGTPGENRFGPPSTAPVTA
jgi:uncharacterized membrane protein YhaH (DUF805 family)